MTDFPDTRPGQSRVKLEELTPTIVAAYAETPCLIWSGEHAAWWRSDCGGYTVVRAVAGRYTLAAAYDATKHCDPSKAIAFEQVDDASQDPSTPSSKASETIADRVRARRAARDASGVMYVDGSIYEGMAACLARNGRTVAHVVDYQDAVEIAGAVAAAATPAATFQQRVQPWLIACFGEMIAGDREERNHRFLEEGLELVQSAGCTASEAHQLVDYVFGRPVGEPAQEVGGVMVTLAALCLANDLDMHAAAEIELERIWTKVEAIRAKQAAKPKHSPLPEQAGADTFSARKHEADERAKMIVAYDGPVVSFDVAADYYLASCDACGWVGSSEKCGSDEADDVFCPRCQSSGADCGSVAERIEADRREVCAVPGCDTITDEGICGACDDWVTDEVAKLSPATPPEGQDTAVERIMNLVDERLCIHWWPTTNREEFAALVAAAIAPQTATDREETTS